MGSRDLRRFLVEVARAASANRSLLDMLRDIRASLATPSDEARRVVSAPLSILSTVPLRTRLNLTLYATSVPGGSARGGGGDGGAE